MQVNAETLFQSLRFVCMQQKRQAAGSLGEFIVYNLTVR